MAKQDAQIRFSLVDGVSAGIKNIVGGLKEAGEAITFITEGGARLGKILGTVTGFDFLKESVTQAASLEDAIARVAGATGASTTEFEALRDAAQQAALGTRFGFDEAAAALEELGRAGLSTEEAIGAIGPSLQFAQAAGLGAAEATAALDNTLGAFGKSAAEAGAAADLLAGAALETGANVNGLFTALGRVGPAANAVGLSFEDTVAALGQLATGSIEGSRAARGLQGILEQLQNPTSKFSEALTEAGISSRDFGTVIEELGKRGAAGEKAITSLGTNGATALRVLLADGGAALRDLRGEFSSFEGAAARAAEPLNNTLNAALERLSERFSILRDDLVQPLFEPLEKELASVFDALSGFAQSPAFEEIKAALATIFTEGAAAVKAFVAEFDFTDASAAITEFAKSTRENIGEVFTVLEGAADVIQVISAGIRTAFNGIITVLNTIVGQAAAAGSAFAGLGSGFSDTLAELSENLDIVAEGALKRAEVAAERFGDAASDTGDALNDLFVPGVEAAGDATARLATEAANTAAALQAEADAARLAQLALEAQAGATDQAGAASASAAVRLGELIDKLNNAIQTGAPQGEINALTAEVAKLEAELQGASAAATTTADATAAGATKAAAAVATQVSATESLVAVNSEVAQAATAAGDAGVEAANQAAGANEGLAGVLSALRSFYSNISEGAREFFETAFTAAIKGSNTLRQFAQDIEDADKQTRDTLAEQAKIAQGLATSYDEVAESANAAALASARVGQQGSEALRVFAENVRAGRTQLDILAQSDLDALAASAERAADRIAQIEENARRAVEQLASLGDSLQDELDREAGNEEAIARRRLEARLREIDELAKAAGSSGQQQAEQARRNAQALFEIELKQIRGKADAQIEADDRVDDNRRRKSSGGGGGGGGLGDTAPAPDAAAPPASFRQPPPPNVTNITINGVIAEDLQTFAAKVVPEINRFNARLDRQRR